MDKELIKQAFMAGYKSAKDKNKDEKKQAPAVPEVPKPEFSGLGVKGNTLALLLSGTAGARAATYKPVAGAGFFKNLKGRAGRTALPLLALAALGSYGKYESMKKQRRWDEANERKRKHILDLLTLN